MKFAVAALIGIGVVSASAYDYDGPTNRATLGYMYNKRTIGDFSDVGTWKLRSVLPP